MKPVASFATFLLALIAVGQTARLLLAWPVVVNGVDVPLWASGVAAAVAASTAILLWRESRGGT